MNTVKSIVGLLLSAYVLGAQTNPVVPAGLVYQAASEAGIQYVDPASGQAIVTQRAALNWHAILGSALSDGSIGVLTAGLSGVIHMGKTMEVALAAGHAYYDHSIAPLIAVGAPTPTAIAPVLAMTATLAPSPTQCAENSIFAVNSTHTVGPVGVGGLSVTFTPQGPAVLQNAAGHRIKGLQIVNVLVCVPGNIVLPAVVPVPAKADVQGLDAPGTIQASELFRMPLHEVAWK